MNANVRAVLINTCSAHGRNISIPLESEKTRGIMELGDNSL